MALEVGFAIRGQASAALLALIVASPLSQAAPVRLLLENGADAAGGAEVFGVSYGSHASFLSNTIASSAFSQVDINPNFNGVGFTFDGSRYHLLLERDVDAAAGAEVFAVSYNSYADFLSNTIASSAFSQVDINPNFNAAGFDFDGSQYHLLLERDVDAAAGAEVFVVSYDSYADFLNNAIASSAFSQIDINPNFSSVGLATEWMRATAQVPEPGSLALVAAALASCALLRQRRRRPARLADPASL